MAGTEFDRDAIKTFVSGKALHIALTKVKNWTTTQISNHNSVTGRHLPASTTTSALLYLKAGANAEATWTTIPNSDSYTGVESPSSTTLATQKAVCGSYTALNGAKAAKSAAISSITRSGTTFTYTMADGTTTGTFTQQDNNDLTKVASSNKAATKLFLVGTTSQDANGVVGYSNSKCYVGTDDCLYSNGTKVLTSHQDISGKAPTSHASSATTYGVGTASNYGHVKLSDTYSGTANTSAKAANSIGASQWALQTAYNTLNSNKAATSQFTAFENFSTTVASWFKSTAAATVYGAGRWTGLRYIRVAFSCSGGDTALVASIPSAYLPKVSHIQAYGCNPSGGHPVDKFLWIYASGSMNIYGSWTGQAMFSIGWFY